MQLHLARDQRIIALAITPSPSTPPLYHYRYHGRNHNWHSHRRHHHQLNKPLPCCHCHRGRTWHWNADCCSGHEACEKFHPAYRRLARTLSRSGNSIGVYYVDTTQLPEDNKHHVSSEAQPSRPELSTGSHVHLLLWILLWSLTLSLPSSKSTFS